MNMANSKADQICDLFLELESMGIFDSEVVESTREAIKDRINKILSEPIKEASQQPTS